jgi:ABC-type branched-subunit amino acid transport system substrate-binding protein
MRKSAVAIAAVALAMGIAACSSGSGSSASGSGSGTAGSSAYKDTANPNLPPIKVGMIAPIGTANSNLPDLRAGLVAGVLGVNARGGLNGHRVVMVFCNDQSDPNVGATCARQMVSDKVVAVLGGAGSSYSQAQVEPILAAAGIPVIGSEASAPSLFSAKNVYWIEPASPFIYQALIAYAVKEKLLPMAVAAADNPAGQEYAGFLGTTLKTLSGQSFVKTVLVADNTVDYSPIAGALAATNAKSVLNVIGSAQELGLAQAMYQQGSHAVQLDYGTLTSTELSSSGPAAGLIVTGAGLPAFNDPTMKEFREDMAAEKATGDSAASLNSASTVAPYGWLALQALVQVTKGMTTITAQSVTQALNGAKDIDLSGIVPPWTPTKPGPAGYSRISNTAVWFAGFKDGDFYALADTALSQNSIMAGAAPVQLPPGASQ